MPSDDAAPTSPVPPGWSPRPLPAPAPAGVPAPAGTTGPTDAVPPAGGTFPPAGAALPPLAHPVQPPAVPPAVLGVPGGPVAPEPVHRRSRAVPVLAAVLVVVLVGAGLLLWRMVVTTDAWERHSAQWEDLARTHGAQLATAQQDLEAAQAELTDTKAQLATAQDRITQLADEKAQLGDTTAAQQQLADYQARVSQAAGQVATALANCIDGQQRLIGYLEEADRYDPADLQRFENDVTTVCGAATDANAALQRELQK